jgi:hypothetical protein
MNKTIEKQLLTDAADCSGRAAMERACVDVFHLARGIVEKHTDIYLLAAVAARAHEEDPKPMVGFNLWMLVCQTILPTAATPQPFRGTRPNWLSTAPSDGDEFAGGLVAGKQRD